MPSRDKITATLNGQIAAFVERSAFFRYWKAGQVNLAVAGRFLASFDALVKSFPGLIAAGAARAKDEASRAHALPVRPDAACSSYSAQQLLPLPVWSQSFS